MKPLLLSLIALALFTVACLGGSLSLCLGSATTRTHDSALFVDFANLVVAGVLLGVSVFHMLPDALKSSSLTTSQAVGVYVLGFLVVSLLDKIFTHEHHHHDNHQEEVAGDDDADKQRQQSQPDEELATEASPLLSDKDSEQESSFGTDSSSAFSCLSCRHEEEDKGVSMQQPKEEPNGVYVSFSDLQQQQDPPSSEEQEKPSQPTSHKMTTASAWSLWLALSLHSLLEGAPLGAQPDRLDLALGLFLHKGLVAFSVTTSWRQQPSVILWMFLCLTFFVMTPVGMFLGWKFMQEHQHQDDQEDNMVDGIVAALAGGTFLYVGINELLLPAWQHTASGTSTTSGGGLYSIFAVAAGMCLVILFETP